MGQYITWQDLINLGILLTDIAAVLLMIYYHRDDHKKK